MTERAALLARIAELEAQNAELAASANRRIAEAQERSYWLARWQVDIERVEARPWAANVLALLGRIAPSR